MFKKVLSATIFGVEVKSIYVETDVSDGLPSVTMIGYLTSQTKEAADRVRTALRNIGYVLPPKRITINLSPANLRKDGSRFDLPICVGILASLGKLNETIIDKSLFVGELSLNGKINAVTGVLPIIAHAKNIGCNYCIIPKENEHESRKIEGIQCVPVSNLTDVISFLNQGMYQTIEKQEENWIPTYEEDFADIRGQGALKRAVEVAASGFHNILLSGPPGAGKTMIAKRIPSILPQLTLEESLEVSKIHSIAGLLSEKRPYLNHRPFRSPHHTSSPQALAGGGLIPTPGEITLAHKGVLFLDEMPEFSRRSLEILRQPLEERKIYISRTSGTYCFPADFLLIAAMNPCPCGYYPNFNRCNCTASEVNRYANRISQPLLDRIDLCVHAPAITYEELLDKQEKEETSKVIQERVKKVHELQKYRYREEGIQFNSQLSSKIIDRYCVLSKDAKAILRQAFTKMEFSARAYHRILKVARTIADMEQEETIQVSHIAEAICYRSLEKRGGEGY